MPQSSDEFPWTELGRWFAGEMSPEEAAEMERWLAAHPEHAPVIAALREAWAAAAEASQGWSADAALRRVRAAASAEARVIARLGEARSRAAGIRHRGALASGLGLAAALALAIGGGFLAQRADRPAQAPATISVAEYRTTRGQRLALRLADGTQVMLAPGSVLRRRSDYGQRERRLELEGQAYFVVTHDSTRPFTVHTRRVVARDLGTRFDVRAYGDEAVTDVLVAEGKVEVEGRRPVASNPAVPEPLPQAPSLLGIGQLARVDQRGELTVRSNVDLSQSLAWTEGRLVFNDTPLRDVERQLERWYDVDVRLTSVTMAGLRVSGRFDDEPVTQVLGAVARSLGLVVRSAAGGYELSHKPN
jgi:transmembrane sensor